MLDHVLSIIHKTTLLLWDLTSDVSWPPLAFKIIMESHAPHSVEDAMKKLCIQKWIESNVTSFLDHYSFMTASTELLYPLVHG
jgi:hypothetical protein